MKVLTVKYNQLRDNTTIKFSEDIQLCNWLLKADILKDTILKLEAEYEILMSIKELEFRNEWELGNLELFHEEYSDAVSKFKNDLLIKTATEI
jgi:hypothetical protein